MKKFAANLGAIVFGLLVYVIATYVLSFIFGLLLRVPFIGDILYWPAGGKLASGVIVNMEPVAAAGFVIQYFNGFIDGVHWGQKVVATILVIGYIIAIISLFTNSMFSFSQLIIYGAGLGASVILLFNDAK